MKRWPHDELHELIDNDPRLKERSGAIHALPEPDSFEDAETHKLQMMEIYVEAIGCRQLGNVQDECRKIYSYLKTHFVWGEGQTLTADDWEAISAVANTYATKHQCHSLLGNDLVCYCTKQ